MRWSILLLPALATACIETEKPLDAEPVALLDPFGLTPVDVDSDPLVDHRPDTIRCPVPTWGPEDGAFEVQTGYCNYAAFAQPVPMDLHAGDELDIVVWHDILDAAEPATGHVAVTLDDVVVWEAEVAIPSPSSSLEARIAIEAPLTPDARLGLHLHNHGYNTWRFVAIDVHPR
ncbi:MAG: hypothetical protein SFX73_12465 [Kofleriaceae bacterium]|nr:hypothetical protein [Kofleriaceae bacterium]